MTRGYRPDFDVDVALGESAEDRVKELLQWLCDGDGRIAVEVKHKRYRDDRFYVELAQSPRGGPYRPSGLNTTRAQLWALEIGDTGVVVIVPVSLLRAVIASQAPFYGEPKAETDGDNPTEGRLLRLVSVLQHADRLNGARAMTIRRVNRGANHSYLIDDRPADGVTTLIGDGLPKPALVGWAANTTAGYAVDRWDELAGLPPSKRLDVLKRARFEDRDEAGRRGTEVHRIAERLARGEEVDVPDPLAGHVESAVKFLDEWRPRMLLQETVVANRKWGYCGTLDFVAELPDGRICIGDYKTARSGIWGETALQLGAYANPENVYLDADGAERRMDELGIEVGLAVWIRGDGYDVYEVDLAEGLKVFLHVMWVARQARDLRDRLISAPLEAS